MNPRELRGWAPAPRAKSGVARELSKQALHAIDALEIGAHVVVTASLPGGQSETTPSVGFARSGAAEMNDGGEILLVLKRGSGNALTLEG